MHGKWSSGLKMQASLYVHYLSLKHCCSTGILFMLDMNNGANWFQQVQPHLRELAHK